MAAKLLGFFGGEGKFSGANCVLVVGCREGISTLTKGLGAFLPTKKPTKSSGPLTRRGFPLLVQVGSLMA